MNDFNNNEDIIDENDYEVRVISFHQKEISEHLESIKNNLNYDYYIHFLINPCQFKIEPQQLSFSEISSLSNTKEYYKNLIYKLLKDNFDYPYVTLDMLTFSYRNYQKYFDDYILKNRCNSLNELQSCVHKDFENIKQLYIGKKINSEELQEQSEKLLNFNYFLISSNHNRNLIPVEKVPDFIFNSYASGSINSYFNILEEELTRLKSIDSKIIYDKVFNFLKTTFVTDILSSNTDDGHAIIWDIGRGTTKLMDLITDEIKSKFTFTTLTPESKLKDVKDLIENLREGMPYEYFLDEEECRFISKNLFNGKIDSYYLYKFPEHIKSFIRVLTWFKRKNKLDMEKDPKIPAIRGVQKFVEEFLKKPSMIEQSYNSYSSDLEAKEEEIFLQEALEDSKSMTDYFSKVKVYSSAFKIIHNNKNVEDIGEDSLKNYFDDLKSNPNLVNLDKKIVKTLFEILLFNFDDVNNLKRSIKAYNKQYNYQDLVNLLDEVKKNGQSKLNIGDAQMANKINYLSTHLNIFKNIATFEEYVDKAEDKNQKLFDLNMQLTPSLRFEVLKKMDYRHFTVGIDTNCCQRVSGEGEEAAVDSFINGNAGVLILFLNDEIAAQSYFHYVPESNGFILDNIEKSNLISKSDLTQIYGLYAQKIKQKLNVNYFLCGKDYNKIDNFSFETTDLEKDPRVFKVNKPYTDFDKENALNLLNPKVTPQESILNKFAHNKKSHSLFAFAESITGKYYYETRNIIR